MCVLPPPLSSTYAFQETAQKADDDDDDNDTDDVVGLISLPYSTFLNDFSLAFKRDRTTRCVSTLFNFYAY